MIPKPDSCRACVGWTWSCQGFMSTPDGTGRNGVLLVGEALGEQEAAVGKPFVGRAGQALSQMFQRWGLKREDFLIDNCLRCRPPDNKLNGMPYEQAALTSCSPFLDETIRTFKPRCIVAMGEIPMQRLLDFDKKEKITPHRGYVEWSDRYHVWVMPTFHPSYIMRGKSNLSGIFIHDIKQAVKIAEHGFTYTKPTLHVNLTPAEALEWANRYLARLAADPTLQLATDIETPYKANKRDEGELDLDDPTSNIICISFCYAADEAISLSWQAEFMPAIKKLLASSGDKLLWNADFDVPRILINDVKVGGNVLDVMWAWHVLNSDLPRSLEFVAPLFCPDIQRWKQRAKAELIPYNALDSLVTWRVAQQVWPKLREGRLQEVFDRHIVRLGRCLRRMSERGIGVDQAKRIEASVELQAHADEVETSMGATIPFEARTIKVYKTKPKLTDGCAVRIVRLPTPTCASCGEVRPKKSHFKRLKKKVNPCADAGMVERVVEREQWIRVLPFTPSMKQLLAYQRVKHHNPIHNRSKKKAEKSLGVTFDEDAIKLLIGRYPDDPLYKLILQHREVTHLLSTYIGRWDGERWDGGMSVGPDGKVHTSFTFAPSTLRLSSRGPNLQQVPRSGNGNGHRTPMQKVRDLFIPSEESLLIEADFSAIEAVLVGYFAQSPDYIRLAKLGVHAFLASHMLKGPADLKWSDGDLKAYFKQLKHDELDAYNAAKQVVHASNYGMTPNRMSQLHPEQFPRPKDAQALQHLYFDVCPDVARWQKQTVALADRQGHLVNPFGYIHRFWRVYDWTFINGEWISAWGEDAKRALAFDPQSTAAAITKEAILTCFEEYEKMARYLVLQVHDSLVGDVLKDDVEEFKEMLRVVMTRPIKQLPLDPSWGLGDHLTIDVEVKVGEDWGHMR